jgi:hypothetical protein
MEALRGALTAKGWHVEEAQSAARARGSIVVMTKVGPGRTAPPEPESLAIHHSTWRSKPALDVAGSDDRGLMYALLDVAERVGWAKQAAEPFSEVRDVSEKPAAGERGLSIYTMHPLYFESRLYNGDYWTRYFDMLAKNRFNTFVVIFGYENAGYFAPAYPYFFDVDGFPDVRVVNLSPEHQKKNQDALRRMIALAHERGINFSVGLWDHIYRGGVQGPVADHPTPGLVWGLNADNLGSYIPAAFQKFLQVYPEIDVVQFRMHGESGLKPSEMRDFWEKMYAVMQRAPKHVMFEFRLKDFPDDLIQRAVDLHLNFRLETKYWAEQMGMPFHPTHIQEANQFDRRHGYADVLRYPKQYQMGYRLWNGGTARVLLWGDPEYARRFVNSTHLYDGPGYEVNEPLATKMERQPPDMAPFELLNEPYRYYKYEFERYWHFYQTFGRVGYDPNTPHEVWDREFVARFGAAGSPIEEALHRASWILPRIIAYCLPGRLFPTTRGWAEKQHWADLATYTASEPSDTQQFASFREAAECTLTGACSAKVSPMDTSRWFEATAASVLGDVAKAEQSSGWKQNKELVSTITDLKILAGLARYHANRIPAALSLALFERTHDVNALDDAVVHERRAIDAWEGIVRAAGDVYNDNLRMGMEEFDLTGHWKDELVKLRNELATLEQQRSAFHVEVRRPAGELKLSRRYANSIAVPNGSYEVAVTIDGKSAPAAGYGPMWVEANGVSYSSPFTVPRGQRVEKRLIATVADGKLNVVFGAEASGTWHADHVSIARVDPVIAVAPVRRLHPGQALELKATVAGISPISAVRVYYGDEKGGFRTYTMQTRDSLRYHAQIPAPAGGAYWIEALDDGGRNSKTERIHLVVSADDDAPVIIHEPMRQLAAGDPLRITAHISDASGVRWAHVRYRAVNQHQDFRALPLLPTGEKDQYSVEIPAKDIDPKWDFMYFIEAMDNAGNGRIYPDLNKETPYVVIKLDRERWMANR